MSTYTFTSSLLTAINRYSRFNALNTPFYDSDTELRGAIVANGANGYLSGGVNPQTNEFVKFRFANDLRTVMSTTITYGVMSYGHGFSSDTAFYTLGGNAPSNPVNNIDKMPQSTEVNAAIPAVLSPARGLGAPLASSTAGYVVGGFATFTPTSGSNDAQKLTFSTDTRSNPAPTMSPNPARRMMAGLSGPSHGYLAGGMVLTSPANPTTEVLKYPFGTETFSLLPTGLPSALYYINGFASSTQGFAIGGVPGNVTTITAFTFADDSRSTRTGLTQGRYTAGTFNSTTNGYAAGGLGGGGSTVEKHNFVNNTTTTLPTGLATARAAQSAGPNSQIAGLV